MDCTFKISETGDLVASSIRVSDQFKQAMANVKAITSADGNEFEKMRERAIELSTSLNEGLNPQIGIVDELCDIGADETRDHSWSTKE